MYISFGEFSKRQTVKCQGGFLKKGSLSIVGAGMHNPMNLTTCSDSI